MSKEPTAEQLAIANLAVQMLPKIELPKKWQTMEPHLLARRLSEATTRFPEIKQEGGAAFPIRSLEEKDLTPFEAVAEEAVTRARILLDSACGNIREARKHRQQTVQQLKAQVLTEMQQKKEQDTNLNVWRAKLQDWFASSSQPTLTTTELLSLLLPKSKPEMRLLYWREFLRREVELQTGKGVKVYFEDEPTPTGRSERIHDELEISWPEKALQVLARRASQLAEFYKQRGAAILKDHLRKHPKTKAGGKQTAKKKAEKAEAEAAKYGGDADLPNIKLSRGKRSSLPKPLPKQSNRRRSERA